MPGITMKRIIPPDMQKYAAIGAVVFLVVLFFTGRMMQEQTMLRIKDLQKQSKRVQLENEVGRQLNELKKVRDKVKSERESSKFLAEVAKLAGQMNLKLVSIAALPLEKYSDFMKLAVNLELDTTYHELGVFVSMIENAELFMFVGKLDITAQEKAEQLTSRVTARLVISTLFMNETSVEK